jgi:hypothetical protein
MGKSLDRGGRRERSSVDFIGRGRCGEKRNDSHHYSQWSVTHINDEEEMKNGKREKRPA